MMWKNWTRSSGVHQEITVCKSILRYDKWKTTGRLFNSSSYVGSGVFLEAAEWTTVVSWETKMIVEITVSGASRTRVWLQWAGETSPWSQVHSRSPAQAGEVAAPARRKSVSCALWVSHSLSVRNAISLGLLKSLPPVDLSSLWVISRETGQGTDCQECKDNYSSTYLLRT